MCVCVYMYSLSVSVSLSVSSVASSTPPKHTTEFSFLQGCGNENSYFILKINLLGQGKNPYSFGFTLVYR